MINIQANESSAKEEDIIKPNPPTNSLERPLDYPVEDPASDIRVTARSIHADNATDASKATKKKPVKRHSVTYNALARKDEADATQTPAHDRNASPTSSDTLDPMNFPQWRKIMPTVSLCLLAFIIGFESSLGSALTEPMVETFNVTHSLALLNVTLYLLGWPLGTALFGSLCRVYGRRWPISIGMLLFAIFQIPTGLATNIETIFICRFLTGVFGSAPLVMAHSIFVDIWPPMKRDLALNGFTTSLLVGACLGPIAGAHLVTNRGRGWQWVEYTSLILSCIIWFSVFFVPESSALRLLEKRHSRQKKRGSATRQDLERAREIDRNRISTRRLTDVWIKRPFIIIVTGPLLALTTLPSSIAFGVLYIAFTNFMLPFTETRDWPLDSATLPPFITVMLGILVGCGIVTYFTISLFPIEQPQTRPEHHLLPVLVGTLLLPSGLFWFAWTDAENMHWLLQAVSCLLVGTGIMLVVQQSETYTLEIYRGSPYTSSVLMATILLRSTFAAAFTIASQIQYDKLGVPWATSTWGFVTMITIPVYAYLYFRGERLRATSPYTNGVLVDHDEPQGLSRSASRRTASEV